MGYHLKGGSIAQRTLLLTLYVVVIKNSPLQTNQCGWWSNPHSAIPTDSKQRLCRTTSTMRHLHLKCRYNQHQNHQRSVFTKKRMYPYSTSLEQYYWWFYVVSALTIWVSIFLGSFLLFLLLLCSSASHFALCFAPLLAGSLTHSF